MPTSFTLAELNRQIKEVLDTHLETSYWVVAEISEISQGNHCYMELIERDEEKIIAKSRATIWSYTFRMLKPYFEQTTGCELCKGQKVLLKVQVKYDEQYGLSLNVLDIDPVFTVGEMELKRKEILARLEAEGILHMNKETELPLLPKTIAIISSESAAGYQDFRKQLAENHWGFQFHCNLFRSAMQGEQTKDGIIQALEQIYKHESLFDAVVIVRGGGSKSELSSFDHYELAAHVAQFPLPIIVGIGHERDQSVLDEVVHTSVKTPTAAADFLIQQFADFSYELAQQTQLFTKLVKEKLHEKNYVLQRKSGQFVSTTRQLLQEKKNQLHWQGSRLSQQTKNRTQLAQNKLKTLAQRTKSASKKRLAFNQTKLKNFEHIIHLLSPDSILKRGYTLTIQNGKIVQSAKGLKKGDLLTTKFKDGVVESEVRKDFFD